MNREYNVNRISKQDFLKLNEEDVMFITNPGRMGDEDGSTFVIKTDDSYIIYRIDGWMYGHKEDGEYISLQDAINTFPDWKETWNNWNSGDYNGKYVYYYLGFGNGLSVDKNIYDKYKPYLDNEIVEELSKDKYSSEDKEKLKNIIVNKVWYIAMSKMAKDEGMIVK